VERIEKLIDRDSTGKIEAGLKQLNAILEDHAMGVVRDFESGKPMVRHQVQAARELVKVYAGIDAKRCAVVVAAMRLMEEENPRSFASSLDSHAGALLNGYRLK
jgi:hypothetical protein